MSSAQDPEVIYNQIRGIIGEHFHNFCFIVMDDDGELFYDYSNHRVGKMLMTEALEDFKSGYGDFEFVWDDEDSDDDDDEYELFD